GRALLETNEDILLRIAQHGMFAPERVALEEGTRRLTYAQLRTWVRALAQQVKQRGIKAGDLVAIFLPRCLEAIIAQLAVLDAGAAFLPLDPTAPQQRTTHVLNESRCPWGLFQAGILPRDYPDQLQ